MRRRAAVATMLVLIGCSPRTSTPVPEPRIKVADVTLGRAVGADKRITAPAATFSPRDVVYASVVTEGKARRATLVARWTRDGAVVGQTAQEIAPRGTTVSEFHVFNPSGWTPGQYRVEILLDGQVMADRSFGVAAENP
jgi:hypothetical protein